MNKKKVIQHLETIATYLELKGENVFKISAYRKAAQALERDERSLDEFESFSALNGIGKGTEAVILEFIEKGETETLNQLYEEIPTGLIPLLKLQGLGGKKLSRLYHELNVIDEKSLKEVLLSGKVEELPGFGKKTVEKLLKALDEFNARPERLPLPYVLPIKNQIEQALKRIDDIHTFSIAGSLRRLNETVKDIDFIIATTKQEKVADQLVKLPFVKEVVSKGSTKVTVIVSGEWDISVDFRLIEPIHFITTLHHFTGSKDHNVEMRRLAKQKGFKISEYGIEHTETGQTHTFDSEREMFNFFDLPYIPPELRESGDEVAVQQIPNLVELEHIRGDLHMHSTWSDGAQSIEEMVQRSIEKGYEFIAITDHSKFLQVANGLNEARILKQKEVIKELNEKYPEITILSGTEMDILPNGELDFSNEFLKEMDFVIASIHSSFNQTEDEIMNRLKRAFDSPYVDMIAHPTGRLIGRRPGYNFNFEQFIQLAVETDTIIELNANPNRLDLEWDWLRVAQEKGAKIAINTDAHSFTMLEDMSIGVQAAKKGWIEKETVVNTWSIEQLLRFLKKKKGD
ncbi:DNA polymerase/3'-5' exonuclease PolX [Bacillaceae bacterium W0354]